MHTRSPCSFLLTDNWFTNLVQAQAYEKNIKNTQSPFTLLKAVVVQYEAPIRAVGAWLIWIGIMIAYSLFGLGWSFVQAVYFAISTLSTGGHWGLPEDCPNWMWGVTAFFAMLGVPMMAVAMAQLATMLVDQGDLDATKAQIVEDVTGEELLMLRKFGLENGDGVIDSAEYIILCMVRMVSTKMVLRYVEACFQLLASSTNFSLAPPPYDHYHNNNQTPK